MSATADIKHLWLLKRDNLRKIVNNRVFNQNRKETFKETPMQVIPDPDINENTRISQNNQNQRV